MNAMMTGGPAAPRERLLPLEGSCNFRDIGGYATSAGRTVKWGQVYRAGVLSYFTPSDHAALAQLGVRAICDLRRSEERQREPTRWPDATTAALSWADDNNMPTIRAFAAKLPNTAAGMRDAMIELYRALPTWMGPRIRGLFECVAGGQLPVVVHCAAGKDRTGVAIAILLSALGVPAATIIEDYLLTNAVGNFEQFIQARRDSHLGLADAHHPLLSMPDDIRKVLFGAEAAYLEEALAQVHRAHGGLNAYLCDVVNLNEPTIARVQQTLLT